MSDQVSKAFAFRALHARSGAFIIPNPWDAGDGENPYAIRIRGIGDDQRWVGLCSWPQ